MKQIYALALALLASGAINCQTTRTSKFSADKLFITRWSPRAMSGESITKQELMKLFEAASMAPSEYNKQPWRFFYAMRDTHEWDMLYDVLCDFNKTWTKNAAALIVIVSDSSAGATHMFDTGAAWAQMGLQGHIDELVVHGMSDFNYEKTHKMLNLPKEYTVLAMAAVGKPGKMEDLPDYMQKNESPFPRKSVEEFTFEGGYKTN